MIPFPKMAHAVASDGISGLTTTTGPYQDGQTKRADSREGEGFVHLYGLPALCMHVFMHVRNALALRMCVPTHALVWVSSIGACVRAGMCPRLQACFWLPQEDNLSLFARSALVDCWRIRKQAVAFHRAAHREDREPFPYLAARLQPLTQGTNAVCPNHHGNTQHVSVVWCWCGVVLVWCGVVWCAEGAVTRTQWPGCLPTGTGKREGCVS